MEPVYRITHPPIRKKDSEREVGKSGNPLPPQEVGAYRITGEGLHAEIAREKVGRKQSQS